MLRALVCIQDQGITQTAVANATGWSRTQISLSFRSGKLPADAERFKANIRKWAVETPEVIEWLVAQGLNPEALCDRMFAPGSPAADLSGALTALVARTHMSGPRTDDLLRLARVAIYLAATLKKYAPKNIASIEAEAAGML